MNKTVNRTASANPALRAFSVVMTAWIPQVESIVSATTAAKAKFIAWKSAQDAGYETVKFGDLKVRREPEFDAVADKVKHPIDRTAAQLLKQQHSQAQPREASG